MNELAPGSVSLEDDNPSLESLSQPPEPEPPAPEPPPQAAANPDDVEPEGVVVNPSGEKLVPLKALVATREKAREKDAALEAKEQEIIALREKATKYDQVAGEWQAAQPLLQQLRNGSYQPAPQKPQVNEKAAEYAKFLDLYKSDGTPDVERAQKILDLNAATAREQAQQMVQPLYQQTAQSQSAAHFEQAATFKDKNGIQVDRAILQQIWSQVPAELSAQPGVASVLWRQAVAETVLSGKFRAPVTPPPPPLVTESLGTSAPIPKELSHVDRGMMSAANIKPKEYESIAANFKPGQRNELE
jgi:hypothetical protein